MRWLRRNHQAHVRLYRAGWRTARRVEWSVPAVMLLAATIVWIATAVGIGALR